MAFKFVCTALLILYCVHESSARVYGKGRYTINPCKPHKESGKLSKSSVGTCGRGSTDAFGYACSVPKGKDCPGYGGNKGTKVVIDRTSNKFMTFEVCHYIKICNVHKRHSDASGYLGIACGASGELEFSEKDGACKLIQTEGSAMAGAKDEYDNVYGGEYDEYGVYKDGDYEDGDYEDGEYDDEEYEDEEDNQIGDELYWDLITLRTLKNQNEKQYGRSTKYQHY